MDKSTFNHKVSDLCAYTLQDKNDIQMEKSRYPFCSLLQMMDLLCDKATGTPMWRERLLPKVSLYLFDHQRLESYLGRVALRKAEPMPQPEATKPDPPRPKPTKPAQGEAFDVIKEINAYQEVSFKTAPKSVILSKFLETGNCKPEDFATQAAPSVEDLGKKSVREDDSLDTETLAIVCEKQGKYERAVSIYEKLITKYPEKSSTFAIRIAELKEKIENKK
ncbi:MAG: hypothetical protein IJM88_03230 [Bacteroidales bacterium]|nr:hypothetical protein [Bacteroidales bacterium]